VWRHTVGCVLRVFTGRDVHIEDVFRFGKFIKERNLRDDLVELRSVREVV